jgi:hypothetical protein
MMAPMPTPIVAVSGSLKNSLLATAVSATPSHR